MITQGPLITDERNSSKWTGLYVGRRPRTTKFNYSGWYTQSEN